MNSEIKLLSPEVLPGEAAKKRNENLRDLALPSSKETTQAKPENATVAPEVLHAAVNALNQHFMVTRTDIRFSVERDIGVLVVAVVDAHDGRVLIQIPNEQALRAARELGQGQQSDSLIRAVA